MKWISLILATAILQGAEELPWIEPALTPVVSLELGYQDFWHISSGSHECPYSGYGLLLDNSLFFATSSDLSFELESRFTATHAHSFALDQLKQTLRYALLDDARGDCFAMTIGGSFVEPISFGLKDPAYIHHAFFEVELHAAFGREWTAEEQLIGRTYALGAIGCGIEGYPYLRGLMGANWRVGCEQMIRGDLRGEVGFGRHNLHLHHFHGYGNIAYRFIDVFLEYRYHTVCGDYSVQFLKRLYARNCPYGLFQIVIGIDYPFTL